MLALSLFATRALAQGEGTPPTADEASARTVRLPELLEFVEAEYPPGALAAGAEGDVLLTLTIDPQGAVTDAEVVEAVNEELGNAAQAAALRFRFIPAYRGDNAVPSRIRYTYRFRLPATVVEPPAREDPPVREEPPPATRRAPLSHAPAPATPEPLELEVRGASRADELRRSAEAVQVVETEKAKRKSADLGEVLARSEGVGVRRDGGLGSSTRFSLNGLSDDQIRFFLDGVPLDLAGYPFGIANVPVNLVERVEIYRGVVPVRFGADALGGAVNLVSDEDLRGTHGSASYQVGSFGTYRLTLGARHLHEASGFFTRASGFLDHANNDYPIDVEVPDARGRLSRARVYRFHDAYQAGGGQVELGFVERPWAKRLLLRAFVTGYEKELQHNAVMTVPYGEVTYGESSQGATLRYDAYLGKGVTLDTLAGYSATQSTFLDVAECVYDWYGRCIRARQQAGEIESRAYDRIFWTNSGFGRLNLGWLFATDQALRLSVAPTLVTRSGDERRQLTPETRDPLTAERDLLTLVSGIEHEMDLFDARLENIAFFKQYLQIVRSEEPLPGSVFRERDRDTVRFGVGEALRYRLAPWLYAKAAYEYATRLPRPDEIFGDAALILANLELQPETSHNLNAGLTVDARQLRSGSYRGEVNGFLREARELIVLLGNDRYFAYQNVFGARSLGVQAAAGWSMPGDYFGLDAAVTYLDFRNTAAEGTFGSFAGDRIPNRPYLFGSASAELRFAEVAAPGDEISVTYHGRYVHEFFRGWESVGLVEFKQVVPAQLLHSLALTYLLRRASTVSSTLEVQNLTNEAAYDFFGVQRPGRAYYFKGTAEF